MRDTGTKISDVYSILGLVHNMGTSLHASLYIRIQ
jgi:hypothetical protein